MKILNGKKKNEAVMLLYCGNLPIYVARFTKLSGG